MIDCHVHLRDWEQSKKETIVHGIGLAAMAGFSAFFDMPNTKPALTSAELLGKRIQYGQTESAKINSTIFYGVYAGLTGNPQQIAEVVQFHTDHFPDCVGLKMFAGNSTGNMGIVSEAEQRAIYQELAKLQYTGVLAVHCEKESLLHNELFTPQVPASHSLARPPRAEVQSIADQIRFVEETGFVGHLHICHISTAEGLALVHAAKQKGMNISCGATAHHALLNEDAYNKSGIFAKMNPPLRSETDQRAIFSALRDGSIDTVESDHAPHTREDKLNGASGVPGFAGSLRLLKTLREAGADECLLQKLYGGNVNRIFGTNFKIHLPDNKIIEKIFPIIVSGYEYNIF